MDRKVSGAFLCLLGFAFNLSAQPFLSRDQNPLAMIHGLPLPANAVLPETGNLDWSASYIITNTLNAENTTTEAILLDYESHEFIASLSYGLASNWALRLDIPVIYYGGGFLDNAIDGWHQAFGLPRAGRPKSPDNSFHIYYQNDTATAVDIVSANNSLADIQLGIGKQLINTAAHAVSLWLTADLPSGNQQHLTGSEKTDFSLQLAYQGRIHQHWLGDTGLALTLPGDSSVASSAIADHVWSAHTGIEWRAHDLFTLRAQLNGHSDIYPDSELRLLGSNYQLVFGGRFDLGNCENVSMTVNEDLKSDASPDVSFNFTYQHFTACQ